MILRTTTYLKGVCPDYQVVEKRIGKVCFSFIKHRLPVLEQLHIQYKAENKIKDLPFAFIVPYFPLFPINIAFSEANRCRVLPTKEVFP